jgi:hypothetical protein
VTALLPHRWTLTVAVVVALLGAMIPAAGPALADGGTESQFVSLLNQERASRGLPSLQVAGDLTAVARRHSERMASSNNLHHNPNLGGEVSGWQKVGENVGRGPSAGAIHQGFMNSASHRANILDSDWTQVGVGVVIRDGQVWVTEVFRLPSGATAAPEPKPKPAPAPAPEPEPASEPAPAAASSGGSSAPEPKASDTVAPAPQEPVEEEPEPAGPRHEVRKQPTGLDRGLLTLARLEAAERNLTISAALE